MNRRTFLRASGFGAVSAIAGCATSQNPDWGLLQTRLAGGLTLPGDAGYRLAKQAYSPLFDNRTPAAVARCTTPAHVQACIELARTSGVSIAARSGGHSYAGYSTPSNGLIADVGPMNSVDIQHDGPDVIAVVGAGARLADIFSALGAAGRCLGLGSCPTTGIAGLTLGGGIGVLTGKYGLTCDQVTSMQVVTADGVLRTAAADSEPELYWGLRGGGGGNFGIVTSFRFRTAPAPDPIRFQLSFPAEAAAEVLGGWQRFSPLAPDEWWSTLRVIGGTPPACRITGCFVGAPNALDPLLTRLITAIGVQPTRRVVEPLSYEAAMRRFGGSGTVRRESFAAASRMLSTPLTDPMRLISTVHGHKGIDLLMDSLAGAAARIPADATAFPHRGAVASIQIYSESTTPATHAALGEIRTTLGTVCGPAGYVNYIDPDMPDWAAAYYGANLPRLHRVAHRYDPDDVFAFAQSIG